MYMKPLMVRDQLTLDQKRRVIETILERFTEAELEERELTWDQAVEGLEVNGVEISVATAKRWYVSDWGQDVRKQWLDISTDSAQLSLIQTFPAVIRRLARIVTHSDSEQNAIAAAGRLKPYYEAVGLGSLAPSANVGNINVLIQNYGGTTSIRPNMGLLEDVVEADARLLPPQSVDAPAEVAVSRVKEEATLPGQHSADKCRSEDMSNDPSPLPPSTSE